MNKLYCQYQLTIYKAHATRKMHYKQMTVLMLQSYLFIGHRHPPLRSPNALSIHSSPAETFVESKLSKSTMLVSGYDFINHGRSGYAASPSITTGTYTIYYHSDTSHSRMYCQKLWYRGLCWANPLTLVGRQV